MQLLLHFVAKQIVVVFLASTNVHYRGVYFSRDLESNPGVLVPTENTHRQMRPRPH